MQLHQRGMRVKVSNGEQPSMEGWLWADTPQGILVSLDKEGNDIRLVKREKLPEISYDEKDKATFAIQNARDIEKKILKLADDLETPMELALRNLNYSLLTQIIREARIREQEVHGSFPDDGFRHTATEMTERFSSGLEYFHKCKVDKSLRAYQRMHDELDRTGILDLVDRNSSKIVELPLEYILPEADLPLLPKELEQTAAKWSKRGIEEALRTVDENKTLLIIEDKDRERKFFADQGKGRTSRWVAASLKLISGTVLTAGNGVLGAVGFLGTITTLGGLTMPVALGIMASVSAGLGAFADGVEKVGGLMKEELPGHSKEPEDHQTKSAESRGVSSKSTTRRSRPLQSG